MSYKYYKNPKKKMKFSPITFTFNGMLKTNEIAGEGNSFHTEFRGYDPRLGRFFAQDRLSYFYPSTSSYVFALDNPIIGKDDNGLYTIFVNGYIYGGPNRTVIPGPGGSYQVIEHNDDIQPGRPYWSDKGSQFIDAAHNYFGDGVGKYVNGTGSWIGSSASSRQKHGRELGRQMANDIKNEIKKLIAQGVDVSEINIVSHSMGAATAEGMIEEFMKDDELKKLLQKGEIVHMSAADGNDIKISENSKDLKRTQLNYLGDQTLLVKDPGSVYTGGYQIPGVTRFGVVKPNYEALHPWSAQHDKAWDYHFDTKALKQSWQFLKALDTRMKNGTSNKNGPTYLETDEIPIEDTNTNPTSKDRA
jgi:RHS repeat-associated protein